jgi:hypothetical protein
MEPIFAKFASETVTAKLRTSLILLSLLFHLPTALIQRYAARGLQLAKESAPTVFQKLKSLPPRMAKSFANSFP